MTFDLASESRRLEKKVKALRANVSLPGPLVDLLAAVRRLQLEARAEMAVPVVAQLSVEDKARHLQGAPLLPRERFVVDTARTAALYDGLAALLEERGGALAEGVARLRAAEAAGTYDRSEAFARYVADDQGHFAGLAGLTPGAPRLAAFLVQASLDPAIELQAEAAARDNDLDATWAHGHCPVCGSLPLIARLREKEGLRYLTCSFCHTEYRVRRLQCPFCQEERAEKLEYFDADDEPGFHVNVCRSCNNYIKTVDFRKMDRVSLPLLDDLESLPLDLLAARQGLTRPTLSAWGF
ncbi:formate dehydrogenase accessory protein [Desulfovibrio sp. X2]|uniref:formate dehydrogenase accessory protein FdhE n=1 Tax=Desulfovibrio sp. X2 TaxID=941449 RepID=UPI0003587ED6|nr:formate dehydrogenase accessory protein FdhE [Desulfovibrio sp. X2]EPR37322.1 formate dehydrogenase accessory protein [Desulfovibrio sp. X2]